MVRSKTEAAYLSLVFAADDSISVNTNDVWKNGKVRHLPLPMRRFFRALSPRANRRLVSGSWFASKLRQYAVLQLPQQNIPGLFPASSLSARVDENREIDSFNAFLDTAFFTLSNLISVYPETLDLAITE